LFFQFTVVHGDGLLLSACFINISHLYLLITQCFYDDTFCTYFIDGAIGWLIEIQWHVIDSAVNCGGTFDVTLDDLNRSWVLTVKHISVLAALTLYDSAGHSLHCEHTESLKTIKRHLYVCM
jgi:hypothetical protein